MALPKRFNETVNRKNRIDSLNDLIFYTVTYEYVFTENYKDKFTDKFDADKEINGVKEFSALDEEQAMAKINNWFTVFEKEGILKNHKILSIENRSFYETLKEKKILDILEH